MQKWVVQPGCLLHSAKKYESVTGLRKEHALQVGFAHGL